MAIPQGPAPLLCSLVGRLLNHDVLNSIGGGCRWHRSLAWPYFRKNKHIFTYILSNQLELKIKLVYLLSPWLGRRVTLYWQACLCSSQVCNIWVVSVTLTLLLLSWAFMHFCSIFHCCFFHTTGLQVLNINLFRSGLNKCLKFGADLTMLNIYWTLDYFFFFFFKCLHS